MRPAIYIITINTNFVVVKGKLSCTAIFGQACHRLRPRDRLRSSRTSRGPTVDAVKDLDLPRKT